MNNWKYAQIMEFLIPYMKNRERSSNLKNVQHTQNTNTGQTIEDFGNESPNHHSTQVPLHEEESTTSIMASTASEEVGNIPQTQPTRKRKNDDDIVDIIREIESNHIRRQEDRDIRREERKHPIETFFQSMAQTTKSMPTYLQNRIKKKVLEIVCEAEEELESYNIPASYGYSTSSVSTPTESQPNHSPSTYQHL